MKVYIVFYENSLGEEIFRDVFATHEAAKNYADALKRKIVGHKFKVEEWEVREE